MYDRNAITRQKIFQNTFGMPVHGKGDTLRVWRKQAKRMTQGELAELIGISRSMIANIEGGQVMPDYIYQKLTTMGFEREVGPPTVPAPEMRVPIPYIGAIAASDPVDWTDPYQSEVFEYVPTEMADRGRFSGRIVGDSMFDLLWPDDLCVFQRTDVPKIGIVCLFVSDDGLATVKTCHHDGERFLLRAVNRAYPDVPAVGRFVGFLVGIVREQGSRRVTVYDSSGIRP
jgi:SOS-response transcriptional repressor LexA